MGVGIINRRMCEVIEQQVRWSRNYETNDGWVLGEGGRNNMNDQSDRKDHWVEFLRNAPDGQAKSGSPAVRQE